VGSQNPLADLDMTQYALLHRDGKAFLRGRLGGDATATLTTTGTCKMAPQSAATSVVL